MSREEQRKETHIFFADAVMCFEKLWLQYCIIELEKLGNNKNDLEILYKLNETVQVKINAPYVDTKYIKLRELLKQETTYRPIICCISTAKVNEIVEKVTYKNGNIDLYR